MFENRKEISPFDYMEIFVKKNALMVSMDNEQKPNVMALGWKTMGLLWSIPIITAAVAPTRYTFKLLTEGVQEFTINIPSKTIKSAIMTTGSSSGRDTNKFEEAGLETIDGKRVNVPLIKDCLLSYECKIVHSCKSGEMASHHLFFGEILAAYASKDLME